MTDDLKPSASFSDDSIQDLRILLTTVLDEVAPQEAALIAAIGETVIREFTERKARDQDQAAWFLSSVRLWRYHWRLSTS